MMQTYREFSDLGISASPGVCYLCNTPRQPNAKAVLSTGKFIDNEGALEICAACVLEAASLFDACPPDRSTSLRLTNRSLGSQLRASLVVQDAQAVQITALNDQIEALRDALKK